MSLVKCVLSEQLLKIIWSRSWWYQHSCLILDNDVNIILDNEKKNWVFIDLSNVYNVADNSILPDVWDESWISNLYRSTIQDQPRYNIILTYI